MAGKRMKLNSHQQLFSTQAVQIATLRNWSEAIDMPELHRLLTKRIEAMERIELHYDDTRMIQSIMAIHSEAAHGKTLVLECTSADEYAIDTQHKAAILNHTVASVQSQIDEGIEKLLYLNTWRAMIRQQPNPMPGFDFNITIPGIVVACLLLGVAVDFESE